MHKKTLRIATRNSPLALWQASYVRKQLLQYWTDLEVTIVPMTTTGDKFLNQPLLSIGGKGLFVKELEESLLNNTTDCAVHSMKDVPATLPNNLILHTICKRDNPFDALLSEKYSTLASLPLNAKVGTSSLRRQSQLLVFRSDLNIVPLRGNIHTRIKHMQQQELDAIILAHAGLERMNMTDKIQETISRDIMLPACGQGALGIECREDDLATQKILAALEDKETSICVKTERLANALLGGNCHTPVAIYCTFIKKDTLELTIKVAKPDGSKFITHTEQASPENYTNLAQACAEKLLQQGAHELIS